MSTKVVVERKGSISDLIERIKFGAGTGLAVGGEIMANVVKSTVGDMARYPTGELAGTIQYEHLQEGDVEIGRVVAGTDHAVEFEEGTFVHFVPYEEADQRIRDGLYPHIKPIYEWSGRQSGGYGGNAAGANEYDESRTPIGYLVYSDEHPFMEVGFGATAQTVVQEVVNQIETATSATL